MGELKYIMLYVDNREAFEVLSDEDCGKLIKAMFRYALDRVEPSLSELGNGRFVWGLLRGQLERSINSYKTKCYNLSENGKKGGRPKKQKLSAKSKSFEEESEEESEEKSENREQGAPSDQRSLSAADDDYISTLINAARDAGFKYDGNGRGGERGFFIKLMSDGHSGTDVMDAVYRTVAHNPENQVGYLQMVLYHSNL